MAEQFISLADRGDSWAVSARDLSKQFGDEFAVKNLSFQIPYGKIFGFIGPSGCGKTTTVRLLTGIYEPTSGEAQVLGIRPKDFTSATRSRIGYLPQLFFLYPDLSVWENMNFSASLYGLGFIARRKRMNQMLDFVNLKEHKNKLARNISGGMQRRLSLAATLIHEPEILFLDEPTAGIDPILRQKFWDRFHDLKGQGRTLFITTQYVGEAAYCDYIGIMASGKLLMVDTPDALRRRAFGGEVIDVETSERLTWDQIRQIDSLPFVRQKVAQVGNAGIRVVVDQASVNLPDLLEWFKSQNIDVDSAKEYTPPFDDVFVILVQEAEKNA